MNNGNLHSYAVTTAPFTVKIRAEKMQQLMGKIGVLGILVTQRS